MHVFRYLFYIIDTLSFILIIYLIIVSGITDPKMSKQSENSQIVQLDTGIFIHKKINKIDEQLIYTFQLNVQNLNIIDFEADFSGSQNISIKGYGEEVKTVLKTVEPRQITLIAQLQLRENWKLKTLFRFLRRPIAKDKQLLYIKN